MAEKDRCSDGKDFYAWKGYDFEILNELDDEDYICQGSRPSCCNLSRTYSSFFSTFSWLALFSHPVKSNRKRETHRTIAKKCLRHFGACGILNIKKDICANRCPTGATDRRLARLVNYKIAVSFGRGRLFLCLATILTDRVSYSKAGQAETQHCN